jgi:DNA-binding MarR family transcriptional regulator
MSTRASGVELWSTWKRTHEVIRALVVNEVTAAAGLSEPDMTVLVRLHEAGGTLRQSELGAAMGWDRTRLSHQVTRMEKRGLLTRRRGDGVTVALAAAGRETIQAVLPTLGDAVRRHFLDKLGESDLDALRVILDRLTREGS